MLACTHMELLVIHHTTLSLCKSAIPHQFIHDLCLVVAK